MEDGKKTRIYFSRYLFIEKVVCFLSISGILLSVISYTLEFNDSMPDVNLVILYTILFITI